MVQENVRVTARVRPSKRRSTETALVVDKRTIRAQLCGRKPDQYNFDSVFDQDCPQDKIFEEMGREIVDGVIAGYHGTIFAYGQTGSGKTHTMVGPFSKNEVPTQEKGLIPRSMEYLFSSLETQQAKDPECSFTISCSFIELYNENLSDLLSKNGAPVTIRGDEKQMKIQGAKVEPISNALEALRLLYAGFTNRQIAETAMNKESSRSHAIFTVNVAIETGNNGIKRRSSACMNFVDLAGSERQSATGCEGVRLKEAAKINQSLSTLARVIRQLSSGSSRQHVPYRDSRLTLMLRDSLGGNSRTAVVVNLHPDADYFADSLSTMQFAAMCGKIRNSATINREIAGESVAALRSEILRLTQKLENFKDMAEKEASQKNKAILEGLEGWKQRALDGQEALASLRVELDFRLTLSRAPLMENQASVLEEIRERIIKGARDTFEDFDKASVSSELQLLKSMLADAKEENEDLRQRLRQANDNRQSSFSHSSSPAVRLGSRLSQLTFISPPMGLPSSSISQTPFMHEASSDETQGSSQFRMITVAELSELEQVTDDQKKALDELKEKFTQREHEHAKELTAVLNKYSSLETKAAQLAAELEKQDNIRASVEERRRVVEQRLADVTIQRDTYASELQSSHKENDEWAEKYQQLVNKVEEMKVHLEKAQQETHSLSLVELSDVRQPRTAEQGVQVGGQDAIDELKARFEELRIDNWHKEMAIKQLEGDLEDQKVLVSERDHLNDQLQLEIAKLVESKAKEIDEITRKAAERLAKAKKEARMSEKALDEMRLERNSLKRKVTILESPEVEKETGGPRILAPEGYEFSQKADALRESFNAKTEKQKMDKILCEEQGEDALVAVHRRQEVMRRTCILM